MKLAELPGAYAPPGGALLVARTGAGPSLRRRCARFGRDLRAEAPLRAAGGEGRRPRPAARRGGVSPRPGALGYRRVRLDTVPGMEAAQALYERLGFREIPPYTRNPIAGARFLELDLAS